MIKQIDSFSKQVGIYKIYFIVIVNRVGWYCNYKGKRYGDFINIKSNDKNVFASHLVEEAIEILSKQAQDTMNLIKCNKTKQSNQ